MSARLYDFALKNSVGSAQLLPVTGSRVKIVSSNAPVRVTTSRGEIFELMEGQGFSLDRAEFSHVILSNLTSGAVAGYVFIGDARFEDSRISGSVRVIDEITDALQGWALAPSGLVSGYGAVVIVAPASNVRGVVVRAVAASSQSGAGGTSYVGITACKSLPTGTAAPSQQLVLLSAYSASGVLVDKAQQMNKFIPPGWGLYAFSGVGAVSAVVMSLSMQFEPAP